MCLCRPSGVLFFLRDHCNLNCLNVIMPILCCFIDYAWVFVLKHITSVFCIDLAIGFYHMVILLLGYENNLFESLWQQIGTFKAVPWVSGINFLLSCISVFQTLNQCIYCGTNQFSSFFQWHDTDDLLASDGPYFHICPISFRMWHHQFTAYYKQNFGFWWSFVSAKTNEILIFISLEDQTWRGFCVLRIFKSLLLTYQTLLVCTDARCVGEVSSLILFADVCCCCLLSCTGHWLD